VPRPRHATGAAKSRARAPLALFDRAAAAGNLLDRLRPLAMLLGPGPLDRGGPRKKEGS